MCEAIKLLDGGGHLACDTPGVSHEWHYDEVDNVRGDVEYDPEWLETLPGAE